MRKYRIKGNTEIVKASCMKQALLKLIDKDGEFTYRNHFYTRSNRKAWAEVKTPWGYKCIVQEIE